MSGTKIALPRMVARAVVVSALAFAVGTPVNAARAEHVRVEIHETFENEFLTDVCGTPVVVTLDASVNVTLRYNQAGLLVAEISPSGGGTITQSAPETGQSISFPFNSTIIDYGEGATIGSEFTLRIAGLAGHVPGEIASDAGQLLLAGFVAGFDDDGVPILEFTDLLAIHGNVEDGDAVLAAICASLNPDPA